ncbi:hypothetical protein ACWDFH_05720, partial [Streptomyces kronopolitis]
MRIRHRHPLPRRDHPAPRRPGRRRATAPAAALLALVTLAVLGGCGLVSGSAMSDQVVPGPKAGYPGRPL